MENSGPQSSIFKGTAIVGSMTLLSRILGFVRDLLFARLFGAGPIADAFFVAFRIPNLLRSVMAEGALTSGFIPTFTDELAKGKAQAQTAISQVAGFLLTATVFLSALGFFFAAEIILFFAPGFLTDPKKLELGTSLLQIMFPYLIFVSLVSMVGGALNSVKIFGTAAFAQVVMNIVFILGIVLAMFSDWQDAPFVVAWSTVIGGLVQVWVQLPALKKAGFSIWPSFKLLTPAVKSVSKLMLPAIFGAAVYQLTIFLNTVFASLVGEGAVSALFYADRVVQFPIGIFSVALASVLLPALSNASSQKDEAGFRLNLISSLRFTSFIIIPISAFLGLFASDIVDLLFVRGNFGADDAAMVTIAVQAYSLGIWGSSCHTVMIRAFIAKKDTKTPVMIGIASLFMTAIFSLIFIGPITYINHSALSYWLSFAQNHTFIGAWAGKFNLQHGGIALSSSLASTITLLVTAWALKRRHHGLDLSRFVTSSLKTIFAATLTLGVMKALLTRFDATPMVLQMLGSVGVFIVISGALKISELHETFSSIRRLVAGR
jgi:putative peptidoglycan lipid II flippase